MRREYLQNSARLRDAMQLVDETKHVRNVLDHVTANNFFEFVIRKRIRKRAEIVNHIRVTQTIRIDTDRAGKFILTTTDVENLSAFWHRSVLIQQQSCQFFQIERVHRLAQLARHVAETRAVQHDRVIALQHLSWYHDKLTRDPFARLQQILTR